MGEGGVDKLLYGRKFEWNTLEEIIKIIEEQIEPELKKTTDNIIAKVKSKYNYTAQEDNVLE